MGLARFGGRTRPLVEGLEHRQLLSATLQSTSTVGSIRSSPVVTPVFTTIRSYGTTVSLTAGQGFDNYLGVLVGYTPAFEKGLTFSASINWGDGSATSAGVITLESSGKIDVGGAHTYTQAGTFWYSITVTAAPKMIPGQPTPDFVLLAGTITGKVQVAADGGVTLDEARQSPFTADVGTFVTPAPGTNLSATINWGDGTTSAGALKGIGVVGLDEILYEVDGSHTYSSWGVRPITVVVTHSIPGEPPVTVATIDSTALIAWNNPADLNGTITGTYQLAPQIPDVGATYVLTGAGTAGSVGAVTATGRVTLPGFIASGTATGTLTLTNSAKTGTVILSLTGPAEAGFGPFPSFLSYTVTGGTGIYANAVGSGTIDVTLNQTAKTFSFQIATILPP